MAGTLTGEQVAVRDAAREYLRDHADFERLRRTIDSDAGWDEELWRGFASELGFAGLGIDEAHGGIGLGPVEQALILEELGRVLAPIPWFESVILGAGAVTSAGNETQKSALLPSIARGETVATLAMRSATGGVLPEAIGPILAINGSSWLLNGTAHFVPFGHVASLLIVAARTSANEGWDGISLIALPADQSGVSIQRQTTLDLTRPYATISFDGVRIDADQILGNVGKAGPALERVLTIASGLLASEQLGGAARSLEETVAYAKERVQFGRVIGSFQAVKHRLADMKLLVDSARSAAGWAADVIAVGTGFENAAAGARTYCSEAYLFCTADAIQLHGGIGFTWEHHAHLFFKRARASASLLDSPAYHRERIAHAIIDEP